LPGLVQHELLQRGHGVLYEPVYIDSRDVLCRQELQREDPARSIAKAFELHDVGVGIIQMVLLKSTGLQRLAIDLDSLRVLHDDGKVKVM
jgi:hypothetical protein